MTRTLEEKQKKVDRIERNIKNARVCFEQLSGIELTSNRTTGNLPSRIWSRALGRSSLLRSIVSDKRMSTTVISRCSKGLDVPAKFVSASTKTTRSGPSTSL